VSGRYQQTMTTTTMSLVYENASKSAPDPGVLEVKLPMTSGDIDLVIQPDSPFILDLIDRLSYKIQSVGLDLTVGGSLTSESVRIFSERKERLGDRVSSLETRKAIFPAERMLKEKDVLKESLRFEEIYLRFKLECEAWLSRVDQERLTKLKSRF